MRLLLRVFPFKVEARVIKVDKYAIDDYISLSEAIICDMAATLQDAVYLDEGINFGISPADAVSIAEQLIIDMSAAMSDSLSLAEEVSFFITTELKPIGESMINSHPIG